MSKKNEKIAGIIEALRGRELDARYLGYFECFNRQLFFEAHEVLEELWLAERGGPRDLFYKGLIQLAGAFVHFQKNRLQPAASLLKLAQTNLSKYPTVYESLDTTRIRELIGTWLAGLQPAVSVNNPLSCGDNPKLVLQAVSGKEVRFTGVPPKAAGL
ncbi:MAG TPA: DUF309 domain-containing protein [Candidatus Acidoferrum sp.]|jgi:predicted metal-dependent hydrolase|nr:DUF309 domain-containing protein [Candidatus Acidoferrum sp.]